MHIYELWRKNESKPNTRKYVTVASDTTHARHLVAKYIVDNEDTDYFNGAALDAGYPLESDMRQRGTSGFWNTGSIWDECLQKKRDNRAGVVYTYIC